MDISVIASLAATVSPFAINALKRALDVTLAEKKVEPIKATESEGIVQELRAKEQALQIDSTEVKVQQTRKVLDRQLSILDQERERLAPIASREHLLAFVFVVLASTVFLIAIILIVLGVTQQAIGTFAASVIPGFLGAVFFRREAIIEKRLSEIASDMRKSEVVRERLSVLEEGLAIVPQETRETFAKVFIEKHFS